MPKLSPLALRENLQDTLKIAARTADAKVSNRQLAEDFCKLNPKLIEPFTAEIVVTHFANQLGYLRAKIRRQMNKQLVFEEKLGFSHLPKTVEVTPGRIIPRGEATRNQFRRLKAQALDASKATAARILEEIDRGDALFALYTKHPKTQRIKWNEVVSREAAKAIQQGLFDAPEFDF